MVHDMIIPDLCCPWCGAKAINITTHDHVGPGKFICSGQPCHEWLDGEGPEPEIEMDPERPGILRRIASKFSTLL
jgi:hypothetical protein